MIGILGSNEVRENNIGIFILDSVNLLLQLLPFILIVGVSYYFENNWFTIIIKYLLLIISFFTSVFIINKFVDSFNGRKEKIESAVKLITCIVGLGTLISQIIKFLSTGAQEKTLRGEIRR